jgi:hypothetical protein
MCKENPQKRVDSLPFEPFLFGYAEPIVDRTDPRGIDRKEPWCPTRFTKVEEESTDDD